MEFIDLGLIDYPQAYAIQKTAVTDVIAGAEDRVFFCEHPAILTLGRIADQQYILAPVQELRQRGIPVISVDRGGEVTLHAPGQLVVYPIIHLKHDGKDLKKYLNDLEGVGCLFLEQYGIPSTRKDGKTGVWVGAHKVISLGVGAKKWVTFHGMGININTDLSLFSLINPCGLGAPMASVQSLTGKAIDIAESKKIFEKVFRQYFRGI